MYFDYLFKWRCKMNMNHVVGILFASALLVFSSSAMAQQAQAPRNALRAGESALSFQVPFGGNPYAEGAGPSSGSGALGGLLTGLAGDSVLGYHYMMTDNIRGGLNLGFNLTSTTPKSVDANGDITTGDGSTAFGLTIAPQLNYYPSTRGTVSMFYFGQVLFSTFSDGSDTTTGDFEEAVNDTEKTFTPSESSVLNLAGGVGVEWFPVTRFSISGQVGLNVNILSPDEAGAGGAAVTERGIGLNLFTSALAANIYF
jgi:hypothetical protein